MSSCRFQLVPLQEGESFDKTPTYLCLELPCFESGVTVVSTALDTHATYFHNADYVETLTE